MNSLPQLHLDILLPTQICVFFFKNKNKIYRVPLWCHCGNCPLVWPTRDHNVKGN